MDPNRVEEASPATSEEKPIVDTATAAEGAPATTDAKPAESSAADAPDANKRTLADVVRDVVEAKPASEDSSTTAGVQEEKPKGEGEPAKAEDAKLEGDDSELPFHTHPRFQKLLRERNEFKPQAESFREITTFMDVHGLAPAEVAEGFEIMAKLKSSDPGQLRQALDWFEPRLSALRETLGVTLPKDLQDKVDGGALDEDVAKELAETRAAAALHGRQDKARTEAATEVATTDQMVAAANAVAGAVQKWEDGVKASDPDYAKKAELIQSTALAIAMREGKPTTPDAAVTLAKRAYDQVNGAFKGLLPKRGPVDTTTPAGSSARNTAPAPTTLRGAIEAALG